MSRDKLKRLSDLAGTWVTEKEFAELFGLHRGTLTNWRFMDRRLGLTAARPGFPTYRRFGGAYRYRVDGEPTAMQANESAVLEGAGVNQ